MNRSRASFKLNPWGVASLLLLVGDYGLWVFSFHMEDLGKPLFSRLTGLEQCVIAQLAAVVCGVLAMRRGSKAWLLTVVPATLVMLSCYFGEL